MTAAEFGELLAYERINPHTEERADRRAAIIALVVAQAMGGAKTAKLDDFMACRTGPYRRQSTEEMKALAMAWAAASKHTMGGIMNAPGAMPKMPLPDFRVMNPQATNG